MCRFEEAGFHFAPGEMTQQSIKTQEAKTQARHPCQISLIGCSRTWNRYSPTLGNVDLGTVVFLVFLVEKEHGSTSSGGKDGGGDREAGLRTVGYYDTFLLLCIKYQTRTT